MTGNRFSGVTATIAYFLSIIGWRNLYVPPALRTAPNAAASTRCGPAERNAESERNQLAIIAGLMITLEQPTGWRSY